MHSVVESMARLYASRGIIGRHTGKVKRKKRKKNARHVKADREENTGIHAPTHTCRTRKINNYLEMERIIVMGCMRKGHPIMNL